MFIFTGHDLTSKDGTFRQFLKVGLTNHITDFFTCLKNLFAQVGWNEDGRFGNAERRDVIVSGINVIL